MLTIGGFRHLFDPLHCAARFPWRALPSNYLWWFCFLGLRGYNLRLHLSCFVAVVILSSRTIETIGVPKPPERRWSNPEVDQCVTRATISYRRGHSSLGSHKPTISCETDNYEEDGDENSLLFLVALLKNSLCDIGNP